MDANPQSIVPTAFDEVEHSEGPPMLPGEVAAPPTPAPPRLAALYDVPVKVEAVLGGAKMRVDELLGTGPGSVIELDRRVGEPVDVLVNGRLLARGELVLIEGGLGVTLTEIVRQEG